MPWFSREDGIKALEQNVAAEFLEKDKKAFLEGWEFYEQTQKSACGMESSMHNELTKNDIKKMEDEIEYRVQVVRKQALEDVKRGESTWGFK